MSQKEKHHAHTLGVNGFSRAMGDAGLWIGKKGVGLSWILQFAVANSIKIIEILSFVNKGKGKNCLLLLGNWKLELVTTTRSVLCFGYFVYLFFVLLFSVFILCLGEWIRVTECKRIAVYLNKDFGPCI